MIIKDIFKELIRTYPIKDYEKYTELDWNKAIEEKSNILREFDTTLQSDLVLHADKLYNDNPYLLEVGTMFSVGTVGSGEKLPSPVRTYYLETGVLFGEGDWHSGNILFETRIRYHRNGKFFHHDPKKIKLKKNSMEMFHYIQKKLSEIYEVAEKE
jgi:hypothetical protein